MTNETERALLAAIVADPESDLLRLVYADWLEENGQAARARFIRARLALDCGRPEFGAYADALEALEGCGYDCWRESVELPTGFAISSGHADDMERGLMAFACAEMDSPDPAEAVAILERGLPELFRTTTIRGLNVRDCLSKRAGRFAYAPNHGAGLLASPLCSQLTRLSIVCGDGGNEVCPMVAALVASPAVGSLVRLDLGDRISNAATADALAATPFARLKRFEVANLYSTVLAAWGRLEAAPWFARLEHLRPPLPPGLAGPLTLPELHTLHLNAPDRDRIEPFARNAQLPSLRRLELRYGVWKRREARALAGLRCGELVELTIEEAGIDAREVAVLLSAPWARRLEVLEIARCDLGPGALSAIADSPCAQTLRVLRFDEWLARHGDTALGRPGAFPKLTSLDLTDRGAYDSMRPDIPVAELARDTAAFVATLGTPSLRHLSLDYDRNEIARRALAAHPTLGGVRLRAWE